MKIDTYIPIDILKPFVKAFMLIESEDGMDSRILPDTSITIAFRYKGIVSYEEQGIKNSLPLSVVSGHPVFLMNHFMNFLDYTFHLTPLSTPVN